MKPDWKDAPEWANWLAQDRDGRWAFYPIAPIIGVDGEQWCDDGNGWQWAGGHGDINENWKETVEAKP